MRLESPELEERGDGELGWDRGWVVLGGLCPLISDWFKGLQMGRLGEQNSLGSTREVGAIRFVFAGLRAVLSLSCL